ncbi:DMT family transporter [Collinsella intestinalis]|uniref:DMT family transporter n=1 Tax=Collinsella intestinalis TaxID=147207 RepID=UPI0019561235|nr:DMT family transporter [Collinsella intestinalis]MBM6683902.1 DMT family transporter [Collinsella intestinalis]
MADAPASEPAGAATQSTSADASPAAAGRTAAGPATTSTTTSRSLLTRGWVVCLLALVCCALWGSAIPCIKIGYDLLGIASSDVPSELVFAGLRFMLAGVLALAAAALTERRIPRIARGNGHMVVKLALAQTIVQYAFFYVGVSHASGVKGSIVNASSTFLAILVAALVFRQERLTARKIWGCAIGFAGVVLVNLTGSGLGGAMSLTGEGFILVAALSYATSSALIRVYAQREDPVALSGYQFVLGGAILAGAGVLAGGHLPEVSPAGIAMLVYLAFVSGIAYSLWSILLKHNPTSRVVIYGFMNPVFGVVLSSMLLGEAAALPWQQTACALALIVAGIIIVNRPERGALR